MVCPDDNFLVLATKEFRGETGLMWVVLDPGRTYHYKVGEIFINLLKKHFQDYNGKVTLENS